MFKKYETTFIGMAFSMALIASLFAISGQSVQKAVAQQSMTASKTPTNVIIGHIAFKIGNNTVVMPDIICTYQKGQEGHYILKGQQ